MIGQMAGESKGRNPAHMFPRLARADCKEHALNTLEATEVPVIGALHGQVLGLGLELALAFDLRVASEDCQMSIPEAHYRTGGRRRRNDSSGPRGGSQPAPKNCS